jgi:two-component system copper resistance phosphate regulon response regulator CusR
MRVVLLEDDRELRHVLTRRPRKEGFAVGEVARLVDAEEALRLHDYDCLVLDRVLPDGDALDLVARQRCDEGATTTVHRCCSAAPAAPRPTVSPGARRAPTTT